MYTIRMKKYLVLPALTIIAFSISACTTVAPKEHSMNIGHDDAIEDRHFSVHDLSTPTTLAFRINENGKPFTNYGRSHAKEMHLIVARTDLTQFFHIHPVQNSDGVWSIPFQPKELGKYWIFADFVDDQHTPFTLRFDKQFGDDNDTSRIIHHAMATKIVDGYKIAMTSRETDDEVLFIYEVSDAEGKPAVLEDYLDAKGHSILLSPSGDFIHTHPSENTDNPSFVVMRPKDDFYRLFTQFRINGKILTVDFDWENKK